MVKKNGYNADEIVKEFGIQVREDLTTVDARVVACIILFSKAVLVVLIGANFFVTLDAEA